MKNILLLMTMIILLCGCESEVDKCVNSQVIAWKERNKQNEETIAKMKERKTPTMFEIWDLVPDELESEVVAKARITCLEASSKN